MIETGISKLDEYLGGIPEGKSIIFQIEPGVEERISPYMFYIII